MGDSPSATFDWRCRVSHRIVGSSVKTSTHDIYIHDITLHYIAEAGACRNFHDMIGNSGVHEAHRMQKDGVTATFHRSFGSNWSGFGGHGPEPMEKTKKRANRM